MKTPAVRIVVRVMAANGAYAHIRVSLPGPMMGAIVILNAHATPVAPVRRVSAFGEVEE